MYPYRIRELPDRTFCVEARFLGLFWREVTDIRAFPPEYSNPATDALNGIPVREASPRFRNREKAAEYRDVLVIAAPRVPCPTIRGGWWHIRGD